VKVLLFPFDGKSANIALMRLAVSVGNTAMRSNRAHASTLDMPWHIRAAGHARACASLVASFAAGVGVWNVGDATATARQANVPMREWPSARSGTRGQSSNGWRHFSTSIRRVTSIQPPGLVSGQHDRSAPRNSGSDRVPDR
jgi:hypothetical protein